MSRIVNIISQIIELAKICQKQIETGKYSSTKRLFKKIISIEEEELDYIRSESGSDEFYEKCYSIYKETKIAFEDFEENNFQKSKEILDKIIELEKFELGNITKAKKALEKEILDTVDPYIQELVNEMNKLSFVKQTHFSCSGHFPHNFGCPYVVVEYDWESRTQHNIKSFHREMLSIVAKSGVVKPIPGREYDGFLVRIYHNLMGIRKINYYLGPPIETPSKRSQEVYKEELIEQWGKIIRLVKKYQDHDSLEYKKQKEYLKTNPELLGEPEKLIEQGIIIECPKCRAHMFTTDPKPICKNCKYKIGDIISYD